MRGALRHLRVFAKLLTPVRAEYWGSQLLIPNQLCTTTSRQWKDVRNGKLEGAVIIPPQFLRGAV